MSKLMMIAGLLLAAAGVALGLMVMFSPGTLMAAGVSPDVAATLLVGGILALGLGGAISAIETNSIRVGSDDRRNQEYFEAPAPAAAPAAAAAAAAAADSAADLAGKADEAVAAKPTTADAVAALEKAKTEIADALGMPSIASMEKEKKPEPEPEPEEEAPVAEEVSEDGEDSLYVVEEKAIRGRPARILSDGTVEAETDEGWMRFENLEHLEEYLDAMEPSPKA
jgi:hypothetical protein